MTDTQEGKKIAVGQKVWVISTDNRGGNVSPLQEAEIAKVGKKYFELTDQYHGRFYINTLLHDAGGYTPRRRVYLDKRDYYDKIEKTKLSDSIRKAIGQYGEINIPLPTLKSIWQLIEDNKNNQP
jgi:hypothetical protein